MQKADGDQIENTTNTNQKQADKQNNQLRGGSECDGDENACWKLPEELKELGRKNCWVDKLPNADGKWYEAVYA